MKKKDLILYRARKAEKQSYESHWQECFDYILPRKADINTTRTPGQKLNTPVLYDSTATQACELFAATLSSGLTSPQSVWFYLTTGDEELDRDDEVRHWLGRAHHAMHSILNNSNFHSEVHEKYLDLGAIGTGTLICEEDDEYVLRFAARNIKEISISEDYRGWVDTVDRTYLASPSQIIDRFGFKKAGKRVNEMYERGDETKLEVAHIVTKRKFEERNTVRGPKGKLYSSKYYLLADDHCMEETGYDEFPYMVSRFMKASGEIYGRGPGQTALPDIKMLNEMKKTTIQGAQMTIRPPIVLPHDGYLLPLRMIPGGVNYAKPGRSTDDIRPLISGARIDYGIEMLRMVQKQIMEAFYVERFQLPNGPQMTATEVNQRTDVMYRYMGPMLANLQHQFLRPLIDRVFGIMLRKGLIEVPPESLQGRKLDVRYSSPVARAQRQQDGQKVQETITAIAPFAQADPSVLDNLDGDEVVRHIAGVYGIPEKILRDQSVVKKMRQMRAEARQRREALEQTQVASQAVGAAGPAIVQAKKEGMI